MSLAAADRKPEVLFPQQSRAKVEPDFQSIRDAVTARIGILPRRDERVLVKLGDGQELVIDLAEAVVGDQALPDKPITVSFSTSPRLMAGFLNGTMEPRTALLYGRMPFTGKSECAVRMLDELSGRRYPRQENFTDVPFPAPTTDLELRRAQLREYGYCITKDALSAEQLEALRVRMDEQAAAELAAGRAYEDGGRGANKAARGYRGDDSESDEATAETIAPNQRIWLLHNKGQEFLDLLDNPVIEDLVCHYLEEDFPWVSNFSANIVRASAEPQFLHSDQNSVQPAIPFAIGVNSLFCIDDFTAENGATLLIPGSHILDRGLAPDNIYTTVGTTAAVVPKGSCITFDTRLWHASGPSKPGAPVRRACILLMYRPWARQHNNGVLAVPPSILKKLSDKHKAMLGYRVTNGLGSIQTEPEGSFVGWDPDKILVEMHVGEDR
jgi:ectoine hydroxylase-related dioxygenase (phytanoyl-CoA dioxygenase family)